MKKGNSAGTDNYQQYVNNIVKTLQAADQKYDCECYEKYIAKFSYEEKIQYLKKCDTYIRQIMSKHIKSKDASSPIKSSRSCPVISDDDNSQEISVAVKLADATPSGVGPTSQSIQDGSASLTKDPGAESVVRTQEPSSYLYVECPLPPSRPRFLALNRTSDYDCDIGAELARSRNNMKGGQRSVDQAVTPDGHTCCSLPACSKYEMWRCVFRVGREATWDIPANQSLAIPYSPLFQSRNLLQPVGIGPNPRSHGCGRVKPVSLLAEHYSLRWGLLSPTQYLSPTPSCSSGVVVRLLASHLGEPVSIPGGVARGFSHVGIVPDNGAGWWGFLGISRFPYPFIPALLHTHLASLSSALNTSMLRAAQNLSFSKMHGMDEGGYTDQNILAEYKKVVNVSRGGRRFDWRVEGLRRHSRATFAFRCPLRGECGSRERRRRKGRRRRPGRTPALLPANCESLPPPLTLSPSPTAFTTPAVERLRAVVLPDERIIRPARRVGKARRDVAEWRSGRKLDAMSTTSEYSTEKLRPNPCPAGSGDRTDKPKILRLINGQPPVAQSVDAQPICGARGSGLESRPTSRGAALVRRRPKVREVLGSNPSTSYKRSWRRNCKHQWDTGARFSAKPKTIHVARGAGGEAAKDIVVRSGFKPRPGHSGYLYVGIVSDDAVGRRVFSAISRFPALSFWRCSIFTFITLIGSQDLDFLCLRSSEVAQWYCIRKYMGGSNPNATIIMSDFHGFPKSLKHSSTLLEWSISQFSTGREVRYDTREIVPANGRLPRLRLSDTVQVRNANTALPTHMVIRHLQKVVNLDIKRQFKSKRRLEPVLAAVFTRHAALAIESCIVKYEIPLVNSSTDCKEQAVRDGTVCDVKKGRRSRNITKTDKGSAGALLHTLARSPGRYKSARKTACDAGVSKSSVHRVLKQVKWWPYIPTLLHAMNEDDPDRHVEFCVRVMKMCNVNENFTYVIIRSDEATFK
ncbi:hypothetical protein PR048_008670 [Dryococelus australis]|uniref:Uncharacterized protein n=1 Tax=Dryococelus australis TaxID=614101 RepID=A0ABQ9HYK4_9NEOP|nr:hypothetical protein PR048_008670 [Dryococelus australis]